MLLFPFLHRSRSQLLILVLVVLVSGLSACKPANRGGVDKLAQDSKKAQNFDNNLTFNDVTLEQADEKGRLWWKVKAKQATYSRDKRVAQVQQPAGELYQDGKSVFRVRGKTGEVLQDGQKILLKGDIVATDLRDGTVLNGNELEWRPKEDLLIVRNKLTGNHKQVQIAAQEGKYLTRVKRMELSGQVVAIAKDPVMQLQTEHLIWKIPEQLLTADRALQVTRTANNGTDQGSADQGEANLKDKVVTLRQNARLAMGESGTQVASNQLVWNTSSDLITSDQPLTIVNTKEQVTMTASQGQMDRKQQTATLVGNVQGEGQRNQSQLRADRLVWFLPTQEFQATGNVNYRQANPFFNLTGPQATGRVKDQTLENVVVSGGRVVTEIIPEPKRQ